MSERVKYYQRCSIRFEGRFTQSQVMECMIRKSVIRCCNENLRPPRKNAGFWEGGHARNEAVQALKDDALVQWEADSGYHGCSISETAMFHYKGLASGQLSLRNYNTQVSSIKYQVG
ncbi:transposase [Vibrio crassostreae]|uniref:Transposase n=1 Tax=Vibrio crassostreae TaxID=246167 RepID=A0A822MXK8_9VIBR|nr:hypothetical protein EDB52_1299 [Vibrio crassostreae]TCN00130.1 hypothetical protein EDB35_1454 [Vibrio crassostreae]TCT41956.1 hypothetical protein EDB39_1354 [Vibrio crassostreae]TCT45650.1 hypothetical protein EDB42_1294 [Vibrio crassostreae]TCT47623.1 hypothetical protein EDB40_1349 [Vibrio crassostreae]